MARQYERLFMSREDWDEWDARQWAAFDRIYYGEPWYGRFTGQVGFCREEEEKDFSQGSK